MCFADVDDVLLADVQPVNRETKIGVITISEPQVCAKPVPGAFRVVRQDEQMLKKSQAHVVSFSRVDQQSIQAPRVCTAKPFAARGFHQRKFRNKRQEAKPRNKAIHS